jgi:hypothetical protein
VWVQTLFFCCGLGTARAGGQASLMFAKDGYLCDALMVIANASVSDFGEGLAWWLSQN